MSLIYKQLSVSEKISIHRSMYILTLEFLEQYNWEDSVIFSEEDFLSHLYFYWLRTSVERKYRWCEMDSIDLFSECFSFEMKDSLQRIYKRLFLKKKISHFRTLEKRNDSKIG